VFLFCLIPAASLASSGDFAVAAVSGLVTQQAPYFFGSPVIGPGGCIMRVKVAEGDYIDVDWIYGIGGAVPACSTSRVGRRVRISGILTGRLCVAGNCLQDLRMVGYRMMVMRP
jgi:hypothetical protein